MRNRRKNRQAGTTLVEMVVTLLLFGILMGMIVGILSPAAKIFIRLQRLQYAQAIVDNTIRQLCTLAEGATEYVKIYEDCGPATDISLAADGGHANGAGVAEGLALEFVNTEGYIVLISAQGCGVTGLYQSDQRMGKAEAVDGGRLLARYYAPSVASNTYEYIWKRESPTGTGQEMAARAVGRVFPEGYYMGNELEIVFSYPEDEAGKIPADTEPVNYLEAEVRLYRDGEGGKVLAARDSVVLDFRYPLVRKDGVTARTDDP